MLIGILYNFVIFGYRDFHGILEFKMKHGNAKAYIFIFFMDFKYFFVSRCPL